MLGFEVELESSLHCALLSRHAAFFFMEKGVCFGYGAGASYTC